MSPEQFAEQTSAANRISQQFDTLPLAFALSASAAIGEEILFRGALQPIFGWIPTSIFFALLHIQYTLTPAALIIFVVSLGLGWVRIRQSTTAAIIAHFLYNFVPLVLQVIVGSAGGSA
jgi:membrane protease YdiL (CAAX protease family)